MPDPLIQPKLEEAKRRIADCRATGATRLDLSMLFLSDIPDAVFDLAQLQSLDVSRNQLTALPERIGDLAQLQSLNVTHNRLTALPERLFDLVHLQSLNVRLNRLTAMPERIGDLRRLRRLYAQDNSELSLPEKNIPPPNLKKMNLFRSGVRRLPGWLADLPVDCDINLFGTPLQSPPYGIALAGRAARDAFIRVRDTPAAERRMVWRSNAGSLAFDVPSRLAILESLAVLFGACFMIWFGIPTVL